MRALINNRFSLVLALLIFVTQPLGVYAQVNFNIDSLQRVLKEPLHDTMRIETLIKLGRTYFNQAKFDLGFEPMLEAYHLSQKTNDIWGLGVSANNLAQYYDYKGIYDSCYPLYKIAYKSYELQKDSNQMAGVYNNVANAYKSQGNISEALENYFKSLRLKEKIGDETGVANVCTNIGNLYSNFKDTANTIKYLNRAYEIRTRLNDKEGTANVLTSLGLYYCKKGDYATANKHLENSLKMLEEIGDVEGIAIASYNIGNVYFEQKKYVEAEKLYRKALAYAIENDDKEGKASCYEMIGMIALNQENFRLAIELFEQALSAANASNIPELQANVNELLYDAYEKSGNFKKALLHYKAWNVLKDSLYSLENIKKLTSSELKYQHEKETLLLLSEQQKKDAIAKEQNFRKNLILIVSVLFLILISAFSITLFKRLKINRQQKGLIEEQNRDIVDSIRYAKRIQHALMGNKSLISQHFDENFILFKPKDIVSGDFYWAASLQLNEHKNKVENIGSKYNGSFFVAVCDSTGHGVPGAFMSLLNIGFLNEAISEKKITKANEIFNHVRARLIESISREEQKDGMDGVILCVDYESKKITYAAANSKPIIVRNKQVIEFPCDKMPVGRGERTKDFSLFELPVEKGDMVYLFTDGYADQFGGPRGKKFMYKHLSDLLVEISHLNINEQHKILEERFESWRGKLEQVDDVCLLAIRVHS